MKSIAFLGLTAAAIAVAVYYYKKSQKQTNQRAIDDILTEFNLIHSKDPKAKALEYHSLLAIFAAKLSKTQIPINLLLAANCQHLNRFNYPRTDYPLGLTGYKSWRKSALKKSSILAKEIIIANLVNEDVADGVARLVSKEAQYSKDQFEVWLFQVLEDAICLTFLQLDLIAFSKNTMVETEDGEKLSNILRKTMKKMSNDGLLMAAEVVTTNTELPKQLLDQVLLVYKEFL